VPDALSRTHRAQRRLDDPGHFEAYTRTAMYHQHVSWWRRRKVAESMPGELADILQPGPLLHLLTAGTAGPQLTPASRRYRSRNRPISPPWCATSRRACSVSFR
jgi:DNA-directed RNA polymerase specialized sigma24 family protein